MLKIKQTDVVNHGVAEARIGISVNEGVEEVRSAQSQQLERFERIVFWKFDSESYDAACIGREALHTMNHIILGTAVCAQQLKKVVRIARENRFYIALVVYARYVLC